ncbi:MAG: pimeloyl-ACP methyl ester carboxylesterase [Halioglobus sp.]|jgi:pimeloyl-ACP methyl ester carboxylesterase
MTNCQPLQSIKKTTRQASVFRLWAACALLTALSACAVVQPQLATLYKTSDSSTGQSPVILVHGAFGGRLCNEKGEEYWPGSLSKILWGDYGTLALPTPGPGPEESLAPLTNCGLTDTVVGTDFYGEIENTLTGVGGYHLTEPGATVTGTQRRYYRFTYDWRQDNSSTAAKLDTLVDQIRIDHGDNDLRVDIVAHSMGGLVTRYWLRYGKTDVLNSNDFQPNNSGAAKARKVILVGTPNLGSNSALQQILTGAEFGTNTVEPEVLLTFPSAYQLMPHPIVDSVLGSTGEPLNRDIFDLAMWRALELGPFDSRIRERLVSRGWSEQQISEFAQYVGTQLERARRFVWSLTVRNTDAAHQLIVFGGDCVATPARILIEDIDDQSHVRLWPKEVAQPHPGIDYESLMLEPGDGAVTKASLLARTALDPSIPRHRYSDFPLDYSVMFCGDHTDLPGNLTFQDNLLHILLSR